MIGVEAGGPGRKEEPEKRKKLNKGGKSGAQGAKRGVSL